MKMPELAVIEHSIAILPAEMRSYSNAAKFAFIYIFPSLEGRVIYLDPDVIIQGKITHISVTSLDIRIQNLSL